MAQGRKRLHWMDMKKGLGAVAEGMDFAWEGCHLFKNGIFCIWSYMSSFRQSIPVTSHI